MFSQHSIDSMTIEQLTNLIKSMANSVSNRIDNPSDALEYCNTVIVLSENLRERLECVLED